MIDGHRVLAVIPARGGSKGLPGKNIRPLGGRPMIGWSIEAARGSRYIDRCIVSSDDPAIIAAAQSLGGDVPFVRPAEFATDTARVQETVLHALDNLAEAYGYIVLLQPTSPLRTSADIDGCIELCISESAPSAVTVCEPAKSPYWMYTIGAGRRLYPILPQQENGFRRQNLPTIYALNGAVYVNSVKSFRKTQQFVTDETAAYPMPSDRSVDVDSELDMALAALLFERRSQEGKLDV